jgi:hypothetical protein
VLTTALQASPLHPPAGMPTSFVVFLVSWILLVIASWMFYAKASYQTKKSAHPFLIVAFTIIFLGFTEWMMHGNVPLFFCRCGDCDHVSELSPYPILSAMRRDNLFPRSYAFELLSKVRGAAAAGFVRRPELTSQQDSTAFVTT